VLQVIRIFRPENRWNVKLILSFSIERDIVDEVIKNVSNSHFVLFFDIIGEIFMTFSIKDNHCVCA